jgi:Ca2+-binding RTX toxin-like protein
MTTTIVYSIQTSSFFFAADNDTLEVLPGASISDSGGDAVFGSVYANVEDLGTIAGHYSGIDIGYPTGTSTVYVGAQGSVIGGYGSAGVTAQDAIYLVNDGLISDTALDADGVVLLAGGGTVENYGSIHGSSAGILIQDYSNPADLYTVYNYGTISSTQNTFWGEGTAKTKLYNHGRIIGSVLLGDGSGTFDGRGGTVTGTIYGGKGADTIRLGNDGETADGGGGLDQIYGGLGADTFAFSHDGALNAATIHGFNVANDTIELSHSLFTKLAIGATPTFTISKYAQSASDHLFYNTTGGSLWYDSNGSAAGGAVEIANLGPGLKLTASNFTVV